MSDTFPIPIIPALHDATLQAQLQQLLDHKTKPVGSLGAIEALAVRIGVILRSTRPRLHSPQLLVCAADHGLAAQGVSAYPSEVTAQMVRNFLEGGAAVSVLARQHGLAFTVADCGVRSPLTPTPGLRQDVHVAPGTADASQGPAMTAAQCTQALANGRALVRSLPGNVLLLGEMGIGNTSSAALLLARLADRPIEACTGAGTGLDAAGLAHKQAVLRRVLERHADARDPLQALAAFGGFEIATLVGAILEAASQRRVVLLDGFITGAAALVAQALVPAATQCCVASHQSAEPGHALVLQRLGLAPLLQLGLRLGEGSGAALAWPLLESACRLLHEMASFASAGVSTRRDPMP